MALLQDQIGRNTDHAPCGIALRSSISGVDASDWVLRYVEYRTRLILEILEADRQRTVRNDKSE